MSIPKYLQEVRAELGKVTWHTRAESARMTIIVILASLGVGLYIGGLDLLFTNLLGLILK
jgi:preprotein translocase SecE subunit